MEELLKPSRRGFFKFTAGLVAAPAIVKIESLMRMVVPRPKIINYDINYLTFQKITREAIRHWKEDIAFFQGLQWSSEFAKDNVKIDTELRIRLPNNWSPHADV